MRSSALDILRAVAVILVFSRHAEIFPILSRMGWIGVDLFFVLSGFLVSGLLFREYRKAQRVRPGRFLLRRGFKIYPQFYALIGITVLTGALIKDPVPRSAIAVDVVFLQSYLPGLWGHTWSLAVEEHFYLLLAASIAFLARRGGDNPFRALPKWILAVFAAALGARVAMWWHDPVWNFFVHLYPSHLRIDSLLAGVLLSYYHVFHSAALLALVNRFRAWLAPVSLLMLTPTLFLEQSHPFIYTIGFSMLWMGFGLLLLTVVYPVRPPTPPGWAGRALAGLGRVSYAFYLWHIPVLAVCDWMFGAVPLSRLLAFPGTLLAAFLTTWAIETPFLRLRDRWIPSIVRVPLYEAPSTPSPTPENSDLPQAVTSEPVI